MEVDNLDYFKLLFDKAFLGFDLLGLFSTILSLFFERSISNFLFLIFFSLICIKKFYDFKILKYKKKLN